MNCKLPRIVGASFCRRLSDADLSSIKVCWVCFCVGYLDSVHFMGFAEVELPPGTMWRFCTRTTALCPCGAVMPIYSMICIALIWIQWWLCGFSEDCQVESCIKGHIHKHQQWYLVFLVICRTKWLQFVDVLNLTITTVCTIFDLSSNR